MRLTTLLLCDYAQVRGGLLHVVAGGVNRLVRRQFPAPMGVSCALVMELDQFERQRAHELTIHIVDADGRQIAQGTGAWRPPPDGTTSVGRSQLPHVFDLRGVMLPAPGAYELKLYLDGAHQADVAFHAVEVRPDERESPDQADDASTPGGNEPDGASDGPDDAGGSGGDGPEVS